MNLTRIERIQTYEPKLSSLAKDFIISTKTFGYELKDIPFLIDDEEPNVIVIGRDKDVFYLNVYIDHYYNTVTAKLTSSLTNGELRDKYGFEYNKQLDGYFFCDGMVDIFYHNFENYKEDQLHTAITEMVKEYHNVLKDVVYFIEAYNRYKTLFIKNSTAHPITSIMDIIPCKDQTYLLHMMSATLHSFGLVTEMVHHKKLI